MFDAISVSECRCSRLENQPCPACHEVALDRCFKAAPDMYRALEQALVNVPSTAVIRTSGGEARLGIPLNGRAVEIRRAMLGILATWAELVVESRRITKPERTVPALAGFLGHHVEWLAAHAAARDAVAELEALLNSAQHVIALPAARRIPVGRCLVDECAGGLTAVLGQERSETASFVCCDRDVMHAWPLRHWLQLRGDERYAAGEAAGAGPHASPGFTAAQIASTWRISTGTVYWLASTHGWERTRHGREVRYAHGDVLRTMRDR